MNRIIVVKKKTASARRAETVFISHLKRLNIKSFKKWRQWVTQVGPYCHDHSCHTNAPKNQQYKYHILYAAEHLSGVRPEKRTCLLLWDKWEVLLNTLCSQRIQHNKATHFMIRRRMPFTAQLSHRAYSSLSLSISATIAAPHEKVDLK